jgi:hypothetical protein
MISKEQGVIWTVIIVVVILVGLALYGWSTGAWQDSVYGNQ